jgi:hypothetical protein
MDQDKISNLYRAPAICFLQSFGWLWFFSKKNIMIPNVAEKNILILVEEG